MKELIKDLVSNLINPKAKEQKRIDLKSELQAKFNKSLFLKDYLKSKAWLDYKKPKVYAEIEAGIRRLLQDGLTMNEVELKSVLSYIKAILDELNTMRYDIENGEDAGSKLEKLK